MKLPDEHAARSEPIDLRLGPPETREELKRNFRITEQLIAKYGRSIDCAGCEHVPTFVGDHRARTNECRARFRESLLRDESERDRVPRADARKSEFPPRAQPTAPLRGGLRTPGDTDVDMRTVGFKVEDLDIPELIQEAE